VRKDFPILERSVHGKPLAYLDNAATSQKPRAVLDAVTGYYARYNANIHRGVHLLSEEATTAYEAAREKVRGFVNAASADEIVFVRGTTEAINLVAQSYVRPRVTEGDEILITHMEHHSNIVPWQLVRDKTGAVLKVAPVNDRGELELEAFENLLGPRTRFVAIAHVSNALGTINPVKELVRLAHAQGVPVLLDGAQAVPHLQVDVQDLGCDFYAFSGHKMYGPLGIGALYGRAERLEEMEPYQGGGEMILAVTFEHTIYNRVPHKFEAGTPDIAGAIGLGAAVDYLTDLGLDAVKAHEEELLEYGTGALCEIPDLRLIGTARSKASVLSFALGEIHAHDVGTVLDQEGIAVRSGHHCAQPLMERFGVTGTARASFGVYNTREEVDRLVAGLQRVREIFS
jgi:cysteine desulfurase/selenocysteine lyase